ncbi:MAG: TonB family protein [Opitutales bacterium]|jgi:TonB family protein
MPVVVTLVITCLVFTSIPLAQWVDEAFYAPDKSEVRPGVCITPPSSVAEPPPEEKKAEPKLDIKPPSMRDIEIQLAGLVIDWTPGNGAANVFDPTGILPTDLGNIVDSRIMDSPPRAVAMFNPASTSLSRMIKGRVEILAEVDMHGLVTRVSVRKSVDPDIDRLALAAARKWRFEPGYVRGRPTRFWVVIPFVYSGR